jgi:energy-dependent translational throttle protein EttA
VLLLDEPTNHLDALSVGWLETYLKEFKGSIVAVTHDRSLLEALCEWVVDIEYGKLGIYEGNYSKYLEQKGKIMDTQRTKEAALQKALARELEFIQSNKKGGGGLARKKRYEELEANSALAWSRANEMTQGAIVLPPPKKRLGASVMSATGLSLQHPGRAQPLFENLSFRLEPGQIIGVVGKNGCGKTSLFNFIAKSCMGDAGVGLLDDGCKLEGIVEVGDSVSMGLVAQTREELNPNRTVSHVISIYMSLILRVSKMTASTHTIVLFFFHNESTFLLL